VDFQGSQRNGSPPSRLQEDFCAVWWCWCIQGRARVALEWIPMAIYTKTFRGEKFW